MWVVISLALAEVCAAKPQPGRPQRADAAGSASLRLPCDARIRGRRLTRCAHFVRYAQTRSDKSVHEARCARGHESCASRRRRCALGPARLRLCGSVCTVRLGTGTRVLERQAVPAVGSMWGGEERSFGLGERSELRELTCHFLFERSERSERSELSGRAQSEHRSGVEAKRRPPRLEPTAGAA
jgi:hypothetical protein